MVLIFFSLPGVPSGLAFFSGNFFEDFLPAFEAWSLDFFLEACPTEVVA